MSSYVAKGNSHNITSGSGLTRSLSMTPEQLQRSLRLRTAPGAPRKPRGYDQMPPNMQRMFPEYRSLEGTPLSPSGSGTTQSTMTPDTNMSGTTLRRTYSGIPGHSIGGFLPPPNGSIQGLNRISDSTERIASLLKRSRSPTPVMGQPASLVSGRARSPTLANINEAFSPRTDIAVQTLSVMHACDSEGNINTGQLNQHAIDEGLHKAVKAQTFSAIITSQKSMKKFRFSSQETKDFTITLDAMKDIVQEQSRVWDEASFFYEEQVKLDHEGKSIAELTDLLGEDVVMGLDLMALCGRPKFTVDRVIQTTQGRMYHMVWNAGPSVKLIVSEATACLMFVHNREDAEGAVELPDHHPCQCGTMIPFTAQLCGKTRCLNESDKEESEDEKENTGLNRSFSPFVLPVPKVGATYVRKARDGPQYQWVEPLDGAQKRNEFMKPGHRVVVLKYVHQPTFVVVTFESLDGGILTSDMCGSGGKFIYKVELSDFNKHMELVPEKAAAEKPSSSVEQRSGGSMSEQQSRSRLASLDALKRAQANAKDINDVSINDKKRKAVENPEEDMAEEVEEASTPPPKKRGRGRPKGSTNKKKSDVPFAGVVLNQTEYFKMNDERQQQEAILTSIQRANGVKRGAATRKRKFTTRDGTNTRHAVVGEINDQGVLSPVNSPSNLCRSLSWDTGDSLAEL